MLPAKLEYLFVADFKDGSRYFQTPADSSVFHPLTKSAFWDITQRLDEVKQFTLTDGKHEHTVFLDDGHFKSDGEIIISPRPGLSGYRLVYFRRCQQVIENGCLRPPYVTQYFMGWEADGFKMLLEIPASGSLEKAVVKL